MSDTSFQDSPLRPRTPARWLMPALSASRMSPHPAGKWYAGHRRLVATAYKDLLAVLEDRYIAAICSVLCGDYVHVRIDGAIDFPVVVTEASGDDSRRWLVEAGIASSSDYRHHLVFHGGVLRIAFEHVMAAPEELVHKDLSTALKVRFFEGLSGVTFIGTAFELSGRVTFDDSSEFRDEAGNNNAPRKCRVDGEAACFLGCRGVTLAGCRVSCRMEVSGV